MKNIKRLEKLSISGMGDRLREYRKSKDLTQVEFAEIMGTTQNNLTNIENGYHGITDVMLAKLYQKFSDFDARYILIGE